MIVMSHLLRRSPEWREALLTIKMVVPIEAAARNAEKNLAEMMVKMRSDAGFEVIVSGDRSFPEILKESSRNADLVIPGLKEPGEHYEDYYRTLKKITASLRYKVLVLSGEEVAFEKVLF